MPHWTGFVPTKDGAPCAKILSHTQIMDKAVELNLSGVEFQLNGAADFKWEPLKDALAERKLSYVADFMVLADADLENCKRAMQQANKLGAKVFRALLSMLLCGDRRPHPGGWEECLKSAAARLNALLPLAADLGLCIAMENHQDACSMDLLKLAEMVKHHPAFGITLDTGNPLAVGEGPLEFAREVAPLVRHVHCKDYTIHYAIMEGYRLVRCAAGSGVIDFPAIIKVIRENGHAVTFGVEVAAQPTRTIPIFDQGWWKTYDRHHARKFPPVIKILTAHGHPQERPYSSAWERGEPSEVVIAEEWELMRKSAAYFQVLHA
jgi:sugar phosphate isomerase/epimerase